METRSTRVLIADSDAAFAHALMRAVAAEPGIDAFAWPSGNESIVEMVRTVSVDVVVLADDLPGAGATLANLTRLTTRAPKVILMSEDAPRAELLRVQTEVSGSQSSSHLVGLVRKIPEVSEMAPLVVALVAIAGSPVAGTNGWTS